MVIGVVACRGGGGLYYETTTIGFLNLPKNLTVFKQRAESLFFEFAKKSMIMFGLLLVLI